MHTIGKNTIKDLVRSLVNIPTFHYTRLFFSGKIKPGKYQQFVKEL